jgi:hypothetical protein
MSTGMTYSTLVGSRWKRAVAISATSCTTSWVVSSAARPTVTIGRGTEAIKAKEMEPQHGSLPTPKSWRHEGWSCSSARCPPSQGW